jgi:hypothetical protein
MLKFQFSEFLKRIGTDICILLKGKLYLVYANFDFFTRSYLEGFTVIFCSASD